MFPFNLSHRTWIMLAAIGIVLLAAGVTVVRYVRSRSSALNLRYTVSLPIPSLAPDSLAKVPAGFPVALIFGTAPLVEFGTFNYASSSHAHTRVYKIGYTTSDSVSTLVGEFHSYFGKTQWTVMSETSKSTDAVLIAKHFKYDLERMTLAMKRDDKQNITRVIMTFSTRMPGLTPSPSPTPKK